MRIALALLLASTTACATQPSDSDSDTGSGSGSGSGGTGSGSGSGTELPPAPVASGAYSLRSDIDLTVEAVLPETAANYVGTLRDFSQNPAQTLLDLAEDAGVPAVGTIRDALPAALEDRLEGWINGEIAKLTVDGVPVTTVAGSVVALAETALTQFAIDSTLTIGNGTAVHTLTTLDLNPAGLPYTFALAELPENAISMTPTCSATDTTLAIGDHTFGLAYGEYIWRAFDAQFTEQYGADVRTTLGAAVNCPAVAAAVASKCYFSVCVGHEAELLSICEAGLDEAISRAHDKVAAMRFDAIHFAAGTATLGDTNLDGTVDALTGGVWTAEINAGMGLRHVPATFTATK